jgi:hypothetical protein
MTLLLVYYFIKTKSVPRSLRSGLFEFRLDRSGQTVPWRRLQEMRHAPRTSQTARSRLWPRRSRSIPTRHSGSRLRIGPELQAHFRDRVRHRVAGCPDRKIIDTLEPAVDQVDNRLE